MPHLPACFRSSSDQLPTCTTTVQPTSLSQPSGWGDGRRQRASAPLSGKNSTPLIANNGIEAIALYTQHQAEIHAIIMDIMMPNMDGITAVRKLRGMNPQVKILAISGLPSHKESVLAAGARAFLVKPYILENLLHTLSDLVHDRR